MSKKLILFLMVLLFGSTSLLRADGLTIGFETGDLSEYTFVNDATYPWVVTSDDANTGTYCMKSSNGGVASSSSTIEATFTFSEAGTFSFAALCMGEGTGTAWDKCIFSIDGQQQFAYGAHVSGWNLYSYEVAAGSHTMTWSYTKDSSVNPTGDYFMVDDITVTEGGVTPPGPGPTPGDETTFDFDDSTMQGWTTIDADGDGYAWNVGSTSFGSTGVGHNGSTDCVVSASYINNVGALTPDNYLVSPAKAEYTSITFWACGQDASYVAEHFGLAVSTAGNTSAADFTTIQEWTMTAKGNGQPTSMTRSGNRAQGSWHEFTVDLSAYAGQEIWVAIRHFNVTDMFFLDVDDVALETGGEPGPTPPGPTPPGPSYDDLVIIPDTFNLGERPTNAWMEPFEAAIYNGAEATAVVTATISNTSAVNPFILSQEIEEVTLTTRESIEFTVDINTEVADGDYAEEFTMFYTNGSKGIMTAPVTASLYTAATPDVIELAGQVDLTYNSGVAVYSDTPDAAALHANYLLQGMEERVTDAVYAMTIAEDSYISVTAGDGVIAFYNQVLDFHPTATLQPVFMVTEGEVTDQVILAGDYYMIVASDNISRVDITVSQCEAPTPLTNLAPADYSFDVTPPVTLTWEGGLNATEYMVQFGSSPSNMNTVVDWTFVDDNYGSYTITELNSNTQYFWQVFARNSKGVVTGDRWGFTTTLIAPNDVQVSADELFVGDSTLVKWKLAGQGGFTGEITVADGTATSSYIPVYGLWMDDYTRSEMIYPAEMIEEMEGGEITSLTYYISSSASGPWSGDVFNVYMMPVDATTLSSYYTSADATIVYTGSLDGQGTTMTINLDTPYTYNGGNLLIGIEETVCGTYKSCSFFGVDAPGASGSGYSSASLSAVTFNQRNFLPKTTFVCGDAKGGNRDLLGFNVYYGDVKANTELLTEREFELVGLPYNIEGHDINVTAVYHEGESGHSTPVVLVKVSGNGQLTGTVTDLITGEPVEGVLVKFSGRNEFDHSASFEGITDATGTYTIEAKAGTYTGVARIDGYEPNAVEEVVLSYETTETVNFVIHEVYNPVGVVYAEEIDNAHALVTWSMSGGGGGGSASEFTEGFENGGIPADWTVIDANNDGWTWTATSAIPSTWTYYAGMSLDWYRTGSNAVCSGSYINGIGALNPDEYLVTPQVGIANGSTFSFWAAATDASYPADHFGVAVSTTGISASDFTMLQEWTLTAKEGVLGNSLASREGKGAKLGSWYHYSVDLSAYAGQQVYIAIRHFNCYDQYIMCVDDVELAIAKNRDVQYYTVYRKAVLTETEAEQDSILLAGDVVDTSYMDNGWNDMEPGLYKFGVSAVYPTPANEEDPRGETVIDFETGDFSQFEFNNTGSYPWAVVTGNGGYAMQSTNAGVASSTSTISATFTFPSDGTVSFDAECRGEGTSTFWDKCIFAIDGTELFTAGANVSGWNNYMYSVTEGEHTFTWTYSKDSSVNPTGDYYMVDNIVFTYEGGGGLVTNDDPVTPVVWSDVLPKDMDAVVTVNVTANTGTPEGAVVKFVNTFDNSIIFEAEVSETGSVAFDEFFKGEYEFSVELDGYESDANDILVNIWDAENTFDVNLTEMLTPVETLIVSSTGFARWSNVIPQEEERVAERYHVTLNNVFQGETTNNYMQLDVTPLVPGQTYDAAVAVIYTSGMSAWTETSFTYMECSQVSTQVENFEGYANCMDVVLTWNGGTPGPGPGPGPNPPTGTTYDFESGMQGWTTIDADGDGYNWTLGSSLMGAGYGHNGSSDLVLSQSYDNNYGALTPDNYLVSPTKDEYASMSFWACAQDASWASEHFGVAVSTGNGTSASEFTMVQEWTMTAKASGVMAPGRDGQTRAQGNWYEYTVDLSAYAGQQIYIAIRHFNSTDWFYLDVDDVTLGGGENPGPGPGPNPPSGNTYDFESGMQGWTTIDADGDGYNWALGSSLMGAGYGHNGSSDLVLSQSYDNNYGALTPDNYLVSPTKAAYTSMSFWACAQDASWASEHFGVAVSTGNGTTGSEFTMVQEWTMTAKGSGVMAPGRDGQTRAQGNWYEYTVDLSAYAGQQIYVAIRHFNSTDWFYLDVDDVTLGDGSKALLPLSAAGKGFGAIDYDRDGNWYYYDNGTNYDAIGLTSGGGFYWGIMFPAGSVEGDKLTKVSYFDATASAGTVTIYQGGVSAPLTSLYSQQYTTTGSEQVIEIEMGEPVEIDNTQNIWVIMHNTSGQYVASYDGASPGQTNGSWLSTDGSTWYESLYSATGGSYGGNWNIRAYIETGGGSTTSDIVPNKYNIFMDGEVIGATSGTSFTYTMEDTEEHLFEVLFVDANYNMSCPGSAVVAAGVAPGVTDLTATEGYDATYGVGVNIEWNGNANSYKIYCNGQLLGEIADTSVFIYGLTIGDYTFGVVAVYTECESEMVTVDFHYDSVEETEIVSAIYPNPTSGDLHINATAMKHISVYNTMGQMVYDQEVNADEMILDMSQFESGVYMVNVVTENGSSVKRITVVK